ncbi:MAG TPA: CsgG/HfaB family protein [Spirochaetota bacterium]|nr:CsgG/HfaB family protein [Spirochaetota bacterium]HPM34076.1 CsgG/HfaB family protein [Spirochaetota bacterium]
MKKFLFIFIFFPAFILAGPYEDMASSLTKNIKLNGDPVAVMPFNSTDSVSGDAEIATNEFERALVSKDINVSERSQIDKIIEEQELQQTGIFSNKNAAEVGKGVGAKYVIIGSTTRFNKFAGETDNIGLKINVKIVDVTSFRVISAASGEVDASDVSSTYKRKAPRKPSEYPSFLDLYGSITFYKHAAKYEAVLGDDDVKVTTKMDMGFGGGLRYLSSSKGFFTSGYEFTMDTQKFKDSSLKVNQYFINYVPMIRVPLWVYFPSLSDYTSIYIAMPVGLGIDSVDYLDSGKKNTSKGFGFNLEFMGGLRIGFSESVSFFTDYRYRPRTMNGIIRSEAGDLSVIERFKDHKISFGISLAP